MRLSLASLCIVLALACGGVGEPQAPCCSIDDVIQLSQDGVSDDLIIDTLHTTAVDLELTAGDIVRMRDAGVSDAVIDVANGGPCTCEAVEVPPEAVVDAEVDAEPGEPESAGLRVAVDYTGGRSFELVNLSPRDYTNLTVLINGEYQYRLKKLKRSAPDHIRLASFVSRRTGATPKRKVKIQQIVVLADQGRYSRTF